MKKISLTNKKSLDRNRLLAISNIINVYNKTLSRYTQNYKGRLPLIHTDDLPSKFISVEEYINSKTAWKSINKFLCEAKEVKDMSSYINIMIKNWNEITASFNMNSSNPIPSLIFSSKLIYLYEKFNEKEKIKERLNRNKAVNVDDNYFKLSPSILGNINSLFRLKSNNNNLKYSEILNLFSAEFEPIFIETVNGLEEDNISKETIIAGLKAKGVVVD